jgi:II/X family phage/plasmid replication protein
MLDTIALATPSIPEEIAIALESRAVCRQANDLKTGEQLYSLVSGKIEGSYDHRMMYRIERERWVSKGNKPPERVPCEPFIHIEGSIHKSMLGHNVYGGTSDLKPAAQWLQHRIQDIIGIEFPLDAPWWKVRRVDVAHIYQMPSFEAVTEFFMGFKNGDFPRRKVTNHASESFYAAGRTTTVKAYHKGPEFSKNDRKRLSHLVKLGTFSASELNSLQTLANQILRAEVEIKSKKLLYDFGYEPLVHEISTDYLNKTYDSELFKLLRIGDKKQMETVREAQAVQRRLHEVYSNRLASVLFGVWMQLSALGEDSYKRSAPRSTFYLQRKQLIDAGCSWHDTDVILKHHSLIPQGFSLLRGTQWHLNSEHERVTELLAPYRAA